MMSIYMRKYMFVHFYLYITFHISKILLVRHLAASPLFFVVATWLQSAIRKPNRMKKSQSVCDRLREWSCPSSLWSNIISSHPAGKVCRADWGVGHCSLEILIFPLYRAQWAEANNRTGSSTCRCDIECWQNLYWNCYAIDLSTWQFEFLSN